MSAEQVYPYGQGGEWLKCALHTHSTVSDGTLSPTYLLKSYEESGFDVVAITDHWRLTEVPSTESLITLPSAELGFDLKYPAYPTQSGEFLVYGISDLPDDPGGNRANWQFNEEENWEARTFPDITTAMRWADSQGAVSYIAHPYWNELSIDDLVESEGFAGIEVFNGSAEVECGRGDSSTWWDVLLRHGRRPFGIGTDDQHYPLFELGLAWTMVNVKERTQSAVLEALRTGAAYFSHGPEIYDIVRDGDAVEVSCSPARSVILHMEREYGVSVSVGRGGRRNGRILETSPDGLITRVRLEPNHPESIYRRISVVDSAGHRAWSNPL